MKSRTEKYQIIRVLMICLIINGLFMGFLINTPFENTADEVDKQFNHNGSPNPNSIAQTKIIDLNKETNYPHHNVTIYQTGEVVITGDVNGDNIDDILISRQRLDGPNGKRMDCGAVIIKYGDTTQSPIYDLRADYDMIIHGTESYDSIGTSLAVGDVNGDGYNDILIGATSARGDLNAKVWCGEVYVLYTNGSLPRMWDLKTTPANITIYGVDAYDRLGGALVTGDINNDRIDDIIMSATYAKGPNNTRSWSTMGCGEVYVVFGNASLPSTIDLTSKMDLHIYGAEARDNLGNSMATCDINNDNISDLVIGAYGASGYKNIKFFGGEVYIIYGNSSLPSTIDLLSTSVDMTIYCADSGDRLGSKIACGDLNGDTIDDIVLSAPDSRGANNSEMYSGEVWIVFGNKTNRLIINSSDVDVIIYGKNGNDSMGYGLSAGNINGDKYDDLIIGAYRADGLSGQYRESCGQVYVFKGKPNWSKEIDLRYMFPNITIYGADGYIQYESDADWAGREVIISDINGDNIDDILVHSPRGQGRNNDGQTGGEISIILSGGEVLSIPVIESVKLLNGAGEDKKTCYADFSFPYIFQILVTTPNYLDEFDYVTLSLAYLWSGMNYQLSWTRSTGEFVEVHDPADRVGISEKSNFKNDGNHTWTINFYLIFDVNFPNNLYHTLQVNSAYNTEYEDLLNITKDFFRVENRFDLAGNLTVTSEYVGILEENDWVRGNDKLNWSGLKVVYYETDDVYPPSEIKLIITVWDSLGNNWSWRNVQNDLIYIETKTINVTKEMETYRINISNLPWYLDKTDVKFNLNIDNNPVVFSNSIPDEDVWHSSLRPLCGIQITDPSTGVDTSSIQYRLSTDNGQNWKNWTELGVQHEYYNNTINCTVRPIFNDGENNRIQWRARDVVGNPYEVSNIRRIRVDVSNVSFINPTPSSDELQKTTIVTCGITVNDHLSGVNASSIEFSTSTSGIWDYGDWQSARNTVNGKEITCTVTPTFAEGSDNHILWRAKDQVGNGYHLSENYQIKIKINHPPEVTLLTPENNSIINILTPELIWLGSDLDNDTELSYDIYLSKNKDNILTLNSSAFISTNINNSRYRFVVPLEDGEIYYWTVVPNDGTLNGTCLSSYNKFKIDTSIELPVVKLLNPKDKSNVTTNTPKLSWKLTYSNPDVVTYNIYYAKSPEQSNLISNEFLYEKNYKLTSFILDKPLTPGERYYWTIIPTVSLSDGKLHGICSSGIWSFYVELPKENIFSLDMMIQDQQLSIVQGNYSSTNITIINKGNTEDTVYVYVEKGILNANVALERSSAPFQLNLSEAIQLKLEILVFETAKPQNYTLSITAVSNNAAIERKEVSVTKSLQLQVIEKEIEPPIEEEVKGKEKSDEIDYFLWSVLIIIIILILALFLFVYKSRKIPYVKSEVLYKPSGRLRLALPGVSGKAEEGEVLPPADEETVISLEGKTIPVTYQLPRAVLTKEQELKLLRERFLLRDISEETYKEMKTEIESSEDIDITGLESSEQDTEEPVDEIPEDVEEPLMEEPDLGIGEEIPADVGKLEELEEGEGDLSIEEEAVVESPVDEDADKISETKSKKKAKKLKRKKDKEQIEGPVEEPVAEDEFHDTQEEVHPFPRDGLCKTCGESMDPDMAYCWSCGTKYKVK